MNMTTEAFNENGQWILFLSLTLGLTLHVKPEWQNYSMGVPC